MALVTDRSLSVAAKRRWELHKKVLLAASTPPTMEHAPPRTNLGALRGRLRVRGGTARGSVDRHEAARRGGGGGGGAFDRNRFNRPLANPREVLEAAKRQRRAFLEACAAAEAAASRPGPAGVFKKLDALAARVGTAVAKNAFDRWRRETTAPRHALAAALVARTALRIAQRRMATTKRLAWRCWRLAAVEARLKQVVESAVTLRALHGRRGALRRILARRHRRVVLQAGFGAFCRQASPIPGSAIPVYSHRLPALPE